MKRAQSTLVVAHLFQLASGRFSESISVWRVSKQCERQIEWKRNWELTGESLNSSASSERFCAAEKSREWPALRASDLA